MYPSSPRAHASLWTSKARSDGATALPPLPTTDLLEPQPTHHSVTPPMPARHGEAHITPQNFTESTAKAPSSPITSNAPSPTPLASSPGHGSRK
jgi:hypothetical protein